MQSVKIDSVPQGATVYTGVISTGRMGGILKRKEVGVTPIVVSISRKDGAVDLEKDGYQLMQVPLKRGTNPWFFGNFLMTSSLSTSIDTSTGASNEYDPDEYMVALEPLDWRRDTGQFLEMEEAGEAPLPDVRPLSSPAAPGSN